MHIISGIIQTAVGIAVAIVQIYNMLHQMPVDASHLIVGSGLTANGVTHLTKGVQSSPN